MNKGKKGMISRKARGKMSPENIAAPVATITRCPNKSKSIEPLPTIDETNPLAEENKEEAKTPEGRRRRRRRRRRTNKLRDFFE